MLEEHSASRHYTDWALEREGERERGREREREKERKREKREVTLTEHRQTPLVK